MTEEKNIKDIIEGKSADEALAAVERALTDNPHNAMTVSYTHLTLPTICSV